MEKDYDIGVIGLAVMGQNLVLNIESNDYNVAVYNRTKSKTRDFIKQRAKDKDIKGTYSLEELVNSLTKPRKIMLMVKAGKPVDLVIDSLIPLLDEGDIIIDGGNSYYQDTDRRYQRLKEAGLRYLGTGVSGGEYGALHGPSIMPGGDESAYKEVSDILEAAAAETESGPCVSYLGPKSAGHYVKMVHNGIEYGVMELISEVYDIMRKLLAKKPGEISDYFKVWNQEHQSYLMEITAEILKREDPITNQPLINIILDKAKQKGTGKWSAQDALDLGIAIPTITAGVKARCLSALKSDREKISQEFKRDINFTGEEAEFISYLEDALYVGVIISYAEGFKLLEAASKEYEYQLDFAEIARIWEDGCIIRSDFLKPIQKAYKRDRELLNLIIASEFKAKITKRIEGLRQVVSRVKLEGIAIPALNNALDYFDSLSSEELPANLIQGQRDYFGAHTYQRKDKEGTFHTEWQDIHNID